MEYWLASTEQNPGNFYRNAYEKNFDGLKITVSSKIEAVKFFLQHHVKYVLTESFYEEPLKYY